MKTNSLAGSPEADRAAMTALGPGIGLTRMPASRADRTRCWPGSEMPGVPASDTSATDSPACSRAISLRRFAPLVVLAEADHRLADGVVGEELRRPPGVFGRDHVHFLQRPQRAERQVFQIADGRGDDEQGAGHGVCRRDYPYN